MVEQLAQKARNGTHVQLLKVRFYLGIEGNGKADKLAHDAACGMQASPLHRYSL